MNNGKISYDEKQDILFLYVENEKYSKSIEYENFIIDMYTKKEIKNI
jgi:hypothetical protein